jgi:sulfoacetaldehyde dehydrogenase
MAAIESPKPLTDEQKQELDDVFARAKKALAIIATYDQARVDRLCQAVAWAVANKRTFTRLVEMGIAESGLGDPESRMGKRMKIRGVLRDALRQKSVGIIEEIPEKGIVKYGKPAGIIACIVPTTNPGPDARGQRDLRDQGARRRGVLAASAVEEDVVRDREADARRAGARGCAARHPAVRHQGQHPDVAGRDGESRPDRRHRWTADGPRRLQLRHSRVRRGRRQLDDDHRRDANIEEAGPQHALSKTSDFGSGCSADGNLLVEASIFDRFLAQLQAEGGYLASAEEKALLRKAMWDAEGHRTSSTVAIAPQQLAKIAGFSIPADRKFIIVHGDGIGKEHAYSGEKLTTLLAVYKYEGFDEALEMMRGIYEVGGKGHSCGIYSFDQSHIHALASRLRCRGSW